LGLKAPLLKRKWDKIDLKFVSKREKSDLRCKKVKKLYEAGLSIKDISQKLNLKYMRVFYDVHNKIKSS